MIYQVVHDEEFVATWELIICITGAGIALYGLLQNTRDITMTDFVTSVIAWQSLW